MRHSKRSRTGGEMPFVDPLFAEQLTRRPGRGRSGGGHAVHKTMQLCRQAQRALALALAGECADDVLRAVYVDSVVPAPDKTRLLVRLVVPPRARATPSEVLRRLQGVQGALRAAVAQAITRKRAPELTFLPVVEPEVRHE